MRSASMLSKELSYVDNTTSYVVIATVAILS